VPIKRVKDENEGKEQRQKLEIRKQCIKEKYFILHTSYFILHT
jgi:hypothetical protein